MDPDAKQSLILALDLTIPVKHPEKLIPRVMAWLDARLPRSRDVSDDEWDGGYNEAIAEVRHALGLEPEQFTAGPGRLIRFVHGRPHDARMAEDHECAARAGGKTPARQGSAAAIKEVWGRSRCWIVASPPAPGPAHGV